SLALLRARHAAGGRTARFHPHLLLRSCHRRLRGRVEDPPRDGGASIRDAAPWRARAASNPSRLALCRTRIHAAGSRKRPGDRVGIRAAFDALYEHRYAHHSPDEPVEMVNIRLALIGKRPKPVFPGLAASGGAKPARERAVYFADARKASPCPVYQRETLG